jgi:hypothetical protein
MKKKILQIPINPELRKRQRKRQRIWFFVVTGDGSGDVDTNYQKAERSGV